MVALRTPLAYMLDSNVCIDLLREKTPAGSRVLRPGSGLSSVVEAELSVGIYKRQRRDADRAKLEEFLAGLPTLPFDSRAAEHYGEIRVQLESRGTRIGPYDLLIAAHARSLDVTLITANIGEFSRVEGLKVLAWQ